MRRRLISAVFLALSLTSPAAADEAAEAACVAQPTEACLLSLIQAEIERQPEVDLRAASFAVLGKAYAVTGRADIAARHLAEARETALQEPDLTLRDKALIAVATWQARSGDGAGAVRLFADVSPGREREKSLRFFVREMADRGEIETALEAARLIQHPANLAEALMHLISSQARAGEVEGAIKTLALLVPIDAVGKRIGPRYDSGDLTWHRSEIGGALGEIAAAQVRAGDLEGALATAALPHEQNVTPSVQARILIAMAESGDVDGALAQVDAVDPDTSLLARIAGSDREHVLEAIAKAVARAGDVARALQIARMLERDTAYRDTVSHIAVISAEAGDVATTEELLGDLHILAEAHPRFPAPIQVNMALAKALYKEGNREAAADYFDAALAGIQRRGYPVAVGGSMTAVALARAEVGDVAGATAVLQEALSYAKQAGGGRSYDKIAFRVSELQAGLGQPREAIDTARTLRSPWWRSYLFSMVLEALLRGESGPD